MKEGIMVDYTCGVKTSVGHICGAVAPYRDSEGAPVCEAHRPSLLDHMAETLGLLSGCVENIDRRLSSIEVRLLVLDRRLKGAVVVLPAEETRAMRTQLEDAAGDLKRLLDADVEKLHPDVSMALMGLFARLARFRSTMELLEHRLTAT